MINTSDFSGKLQTLRKWCHESFDNFERRWIQTQCNTIEVQIGLLNHFFRIVLDTEILVPRSFASFPSPRSWNSDIKRWQQIQTNGQLLEWSFVFSKAVILYVEHVEITNLIKWSRRKFSLKTNRHVTDYKNNILRYSIRVFLWLGQSICLFYFSVSNSNEKLLLLVFSQANETKLIFRPMPIKWVRRSF